MGKRTRARECALQMLYQWDITREAIAAASTNWRLDRIAAVDKNILRIAAYELMMEPQTPASVVIDEAVEMAKRFSEADSPGFVNGVLDAVRRAVRGEPGRGDSSAR